MKEHSRIKQIHYKKWQLRKEILKVIILSFLSGGGNPLRPILPLMINEIIALLKKSRNLDIEEKKVKRVIENLEKSDIVYLEEKGENVYVYSINNDNPLVIKYSIQALLDFKKKEKRWNGKWFMVFFDVPEIQRNKRNYLRKFLKKLGFYQYQKSVYIFPYECEKEIILIKKIVEGAKYMKYIIAEKIEDEERIKAFFKL